MTVAKYSNQQQINVTADESFQLSSGNPIRKQLRVQNKSGGSVYLSFGSPVGFSQGLYIGIEISPFSEFIMDQNCTTDSVHCRGDNVLVGNTIVYSEVSFQ